MIKRIGALNMFKIDWFLPTLFSVCLDTKLKKIIENIISLAQKVPEILNRIEADQESLGKKKKILRMKDAQHYNGSTNDFSELDIQKHDLDEKEIDLESGRPRMAPIIAFIFFILRGYFNSVCSKAASEQIHDSITIKILLENWNTKMPGEITILENLNAISNETRDFILAAQIQDIRDKGLDDFKKCQIDSTSVEANTKWPTDADILLALVNRACNYSQKLLVLGLVNFKLSSSEEWLKTLKNTLFRINTIAGKPNSKKKLKEEYRFFLKTAQKLHDHLVNETVLLEEKVKSIIVAPSVRETIEGIWDKITGDLLDAADVLYYTENRIMNGVVLKASRKILSISDNTAAFIIKGNRESIVGYKAQLARSGYGFITSLLLPIGNNSDSKIFLELHDDSIRKTNEMLDELSADGCYASKAAYDVLEKKVKVLSIGGSTGKKLVGEALWDSEEYTMARANRSAVESIIFTLKYVFSFGRLRRRGLENANAELLEKVIAYNFYHMVDLEKQKLKKEKALMAA